MEEEKRGEGERKGNEVEDGEREGGGIGGGGQNPGDWRVTCFVNAWKKPSAAIFQVLLQTSLMDRRGDLHYCISYNILPQYSYQCPLHACNH